MTVWVVALTHRKTENRIKLKELSKMLTQKLLQNINHWLDLIIWALKNSEMFWHNEEPQLFSKWLKYIRISRWFSFRLIYELRLKFIELEPEYLDCSSLCLLPQRGCRSSASRTVRLWNFSPTIVMLPLSPYDQFRISSLSFAISVGH